MSDKPGNWDDEIVPLIQKVVCGEEYIKLEQKLLSNWFKSFQEVRQETLEEVKEVLQYLDDEETINRACKLVDSLNEEVNIKSVKTSE